MRNIIINCANIESMAALHDLLAQQLSFPEWYGKNLDALHDCLTEIAEETELVFLHFAALPFPSAGLLRVLRDSESENPHLNISLVTN